MAHGAYLIYQSPYSPELNLIEILWCEIKYRRLPLTAYGSFNSICEAATKVRRGYGRIFDYFWAIN